jgi:hypothetical protein
MLTTARLVINLSDQSLWPSIGVRSRKRGMSDPKSQKSKQGLDRQEATIDFGSFSIKIGEDDSLNCACVTSNLGHGDPVSG